MNIKAESKKEIKLKNNSKQYEISVDGKMKS